MGSRFFNITHLRIFVKVADQLANTSLEVVDAECRQIIGFGRYQYAGSLGAGGQVVVRTLAKLGAEISEDILSRYRLLRGGKEGGNSTALILFADAFSW